jgi:hypothetical protein
MTKSKSKSKSKRLNIHSGFKVLYECSSKNIYTG